MPETRDDHIAYIASRLKVLKDDRRAIFTVASHAQEAADYLQPQTGTCRARTLGKLGFFHRQRYCQLWQRIRFTKGSHGFRTIG